MSEKAQLSDKDATFDTISRSDAVELVKSFCRVDDDKIELIAYLLGKLPSAQPQQKWETCFDCPLSHGCPKIRGCTNDQAERYASEVPTDCPLSAQPEYEPVSAKDFAKIMSENTFYSFMTWHGEAFTLIKEMGFVICKKTM